MDETATLSELKALARSFCEERDWDQFHTPKELAIGIITEASELLEKFLFLDEAQASALFERADTRREIEDELADVLFFVLRFAQRFGIDLDNALANKTQANAERYPVEKARGRNVKYSEL